MLVLESQSEPSTFVALNPNSMKEVISIAVGDLIDSGWTGISHSSLLQELKNRVAAAQRITNFFIFIFLGKCYQLAKIMLCQTSSCK